MVKSGGQMVPNGGIVKTTASSAQSLVGLKIHSDMVAIS